MRTLFFLLTIFVAMAAQARDFTIRLCVYAEPQAVGVNIYYQVFNPVGSKCEKSTLTRHNNTPLAIRDANGDPIISGTDPDTGKDYQQYVVTGLDDNTTYCGWIRGVDASGEESDFSNGIMFLAPIPAFPGPDDARVVP